MAESPVRAPMSSLLFSQKQESCSVLGSSSRSPNYPPSTPSVEVHHLETSLGGESDHPEVHEPPGKRRCLESTSSTEVARIHSSTSAEQCSNSNSPHTSCGSPSVSNDLRIKSSSQLPSDTATVTSAINGVPANQNGIEDRSQVKDEPPQQSFPKDLSQPPNLSAWNNGFPSSAYDRLSFLQKFNPHMLNPNVPNTSPISNTPSGDSVTIGANALAAAMAMSPLFQNGPGALLGPDHTINPWNPMLAAAAAAAFASGRFPPPAGMGPKLQGESDMTEDKDGGSSSRSGSPMHLSAAESSEGVDALPDGSQTAHHWTFQEQFKQLYELSPDPKRKEFLDDLFNFMQKRGTPVNRIPIMAKQVLDLYELYRLVVTRGGLVEVINKKLWREITKGLQLPSSITSAAFTLRTQYMKYLYPYECEKLALSNPNELQAAIDGNRREARRSSYSFDYPMMVGSGANNVVSQSSLGGPPTSMAGGFQPSQNPLIALPPPPPPQQQPNASMGGPCGNPLLSAGFFFPPGFPASSSSRTEGLFPETPFFGFSSMMPSHNSGAGVVPPPTMSPPDSFNAKQPQEDDHIMKQRREKTLQRCMSSSSTSAVTVATTSPPQSSSHRNHSSPATLESGDTNLTKNEDNLQGTPKININGLKAASGTEARCQRNSAQSEVLTAQFQHDLSPGETPMENIHRQNTAALDFSEFLKQRMSPKGSASNERFSSNNREGIRDAHKQSSSHNGCSVEGTLTNEASCRENGMKTNTTMQLAPNMKISTQSGTQIGLPENTLVVCMEYTGIVYQGVLFGHTKQSA